MKYIKQKKLITAFVSTLFSALPLAMAHAASDNSAVFNIVIEAEDYTEISDADNDSVDDFIQSSRADASSGDYMQAKGQRENSYLEYQINLPADDVYHIAVRGSGTGSADNSFFVSVDSGVNSRVNLNSDDSWGWKTVLDASSGLGPYSLSKGNHRIRIKQRERNAKLDQLQITGTQVIIDKPRIVNITLEAEDYTGISDANNDGVEDFTQNARADASGGHYMQAKGQRENSYLEYQVNLPVDDVYEIVLRGTGAGNAANSFFVSVDSGINSKVHLNADDRWDWGTVTDTSSGLGPYVLSEGNHRIRIKQREANAKIDQLRISNASGTNLPAASVSPSSLNFGSQDVGSVSNAQSVTLSNNGNGVLNITGISTTGDFSESSDCGDVLAVGSSCQIDISFSPTGAGNITGALTVQSSGANTPVRVGLSGGGNEEKPSDFSPFAQVPVLPGQMNFPWFEDAKNSFSALQPDDPIDWPKRFNEAANTVSVNSCTALKTALGRVNPGDMILVAAGQYDSCTVNISRSGTRAAPIVIAAKPRARGTEGRVVFNGGPTFAFFKNAASHYIVGGFQFTGQRNSAIEFSPGKTITTGRSPVYEDGSVNIRLTDNHYEGVGRSSGARRAVIYADVRSQQIRIDHSVFISNYNHIRFTNDKADGALFSASKDARVDHNYFGPAAAASGFLDRVPYEIGAIQTCCDIIKENSDPLTLIFEYNVVEHLKVKRKGSSQSLSQRTDSEVIESKTSGMVVRSNIIWSDDEKAIVSIRHGFDSKIESNYLVGTGIGIKGANNVVSNNYINGNGRLNAGIIMSRWGRRKPGNCTLIAPTRDNLIVDNTILQTEIYGMRIGDCDFGACRPVTDSLFSNNYIQSSSGTLVHFNTKNEAGRTSICDSDTISKPHLYDRPGDADGGLNTGIIFDNNTYSPSGNAILGKGFDLDQNATLRE